MPASSVAVASSSSLALRRAVAVALGAAFVALAAQVAVPLPGTPVPLTLQPLAVLLVGGLLGPALGASSLVLYLALGAAGLPVFTPLGLPGVLRLIGPTGGYLLAYPFAAAAVGRIAIVPTDPGRQPGVSGISDWLRLSLAALAGLLLIHLGGLAQLALLTGSTATAARIARWKRWSPRSMPRPQATATASRAAPPIQARASSAARR